MNIKKTIQATVSSVLALSILAVPVTTFAGFFPADRQTYTCITPTNCPGADKVTFNSFTNNSVVGDERPFFAGAVSGGSLQDRIKVQDGQTITLRAYVHNNANPSKIGEAAATAHNVKVRVLVPTAKQKDSNMVAFISASNASPAMVNDTMSVYADQAFTLEYVAGSANFSGRNGVAKISDTVVKDGFTIGDMHGCFEYSGYVNLTVKVKMDKKPETPETPQTPETPKTPETPVTPGTPGSLPETGPADTAAIVAGMTLLSAAAYYVATRRFGLTK